MEGAAQGGKVKRTGKMRARRRTRCSATRFSGMRAHTRAQNKKGALAQQPGRGNPICLVPSAESSARRTNESIGKQVLAGREQPRAGAQATRETTDLHLE